MKILLAVFKDLWNFFTFGVFRNQNKGRVEVVGPPENSEARVDPDQALMEETHSGAETKIKTIEKTEVAKVDNGQESGESEKPKLLQSAIPDKADVSIDLDISLISETAYVCVGQTRCFVRPVWAFDNAFLTLNYGDKVEVMRYEGRFAGVKIGGEIGWILKDDITTNHTHIHPTFLDSVFYDHDHPETVKLRKVLNDDFFASELRLPLQAPEFISYCIHKTGRKINWSNQRPRLSGTWQILLKGRSGIHIGIEPKTGSVMEYYEDHDIGHLGYVKEVHADNSILLQSIGRKEEGKYYEEFLSKATWKNLQPVFIQVS